MVAIPLNTSARSRHLRRRPRLATSLLAIATHSPGFEGAAVPQSGVGVRLLTLQGDLLDELPFRVRSFHDHVSDIPKRSAGLPTGDPSKCWISGYREMVTAELRASIAASCDVSRAMRSKLKTFHVLTCERSRCVLASLLDSAGFATGSRRQAGMDGLCEIFRSKKRYSREPNPFRYDNPGLPLDLSRPTTSPLIALLPNRS